MPFYIKLLIMCPLTLLGGFVDSIAGGGALITIPAYYAAGLLPHTVLGTNKLSAIFGSATSTFRYVRENAYYRKNIAASVLSALIGSALGARLAVYLDESFLRLAMIGAVPALGLFMVFKKDFCEPVLKKELTKFQLTALSAVLSFIIGAYDGFFGPGAGTFFILSNLHILGLTLNESMGNAKIVNLSTGIAALLIFLLHGKVDYALAIPAGLFQMAGSYIGSGMALKNGKKVVRPVMLFVIGLLIIKLIIDTF